MKVSTGSIGIERGMNRIPVRTIKDKTAYLIKPDNLRADTFSIKRPPPARTIGYAGARYSALLCQLRIRIIEVVRNIIAGILYLFISLLISRYISPGSHTRTDAGPGRMSCPPIKSSGVSALYLYKVAFLINSRWAKS